MPSRSEGSEHGRQPHKLPIQPLTPAETDVVTQQNIAPPAADFVEGSIRGWLSRATICLHKAIGMPFTWAEAVVVIDSQDIEVARLLASPVWKAQSDAVAKSMAASTWRTQSDAVAKILGSKLLAQSDAATKIMVGSSLLAQSDALAKIVAGSMWKTQSDALARIAAEHERKEAAAPRQEVPTSPFVEDELGEDAELALRDVAQILGARGNPQVLDNDVFDPPIELTESDLEFVAVYAGILCTTMLVWLSIAHIEVAAVVVSAVQFIGYGRAVKRLASIKLRGEVGAGGS